MSIPPPPYTLQPAPPPVPDRRRKRLIVVASVLGGVVGLGVLGLAAVGAASLLGGSDRPTVQSASSPRPSASATPAVVSSPSPAPVVTPKVEDLQLTAKIKDKQCFGSAGCNVQFAIDLGYGGPPLDPDTTWEITYEVSGVEDGPLIGTLQVTGTQYTVPERSAQTKKKDDQLTVKVAGVSKRGL
jgi:hypothetical protein